MNVAAWDEKEGGLWLENRQHLKPEKQEQLNIVVFSSFFAEGVSLLNGADGFIFHQPYYKLVMKSFARLLLNDFLADHDPDYKGRYAGLEAFRLVCGHLVGPEWIDDNW